jgi:hypothetical protein
MNIRMKRTRKKCVRNCKREVGNRGTVIEFYSITSTSAIILMNRRGSTGLTRY